MNKVLILNGSPHQHGCTATALDEMIKVFSDAKVKYGYPEVERGCFTSFPDGK